MKAAKNSIALKRQFAWIKKATDWAGFSSICQRLKISTIMLLQPQYNGSENGKMHLFVCFWWIDSLIWL